VRIGIHPKIEKALNSDYECMTDEGGTGKMTGKPPTVTYHLLATTQPNSKELS
jgi:hypothetical protein